LRQLALWLLFCSNLKSSSFDDVPGNEVLKQTEFAEVGLRPYRGATLSKVAPREGPKANWSGRGRRVKYKSERVPLIGKSVLGHGRTAVVQVVMARNQISKEIHGGYQLGGGTRAAEKCILINAFRQ
jgi:hypothetical protein